MGPHEPQIIRLTEATFYILLSLTPGEKHGYAILKDVETLSQRRVVLSISTLYSALERMQTQGLIGRVDDVSPPAAPGLPRKVYHLTGAGQNALEAELEYLKNMVNAGKARLAGLNNLETKTYLWTG